TAFNADFDGDQMAVHVPLSLEAQLEARALMMSSNNILSPANGEPIIVPSQDVVLGLYYMSRALENQQGEGMVFANVAEVKRAYDNKAVGLHAKVKVRITETVIDEEGNRERRSSIVDTTAGRALLDEILPEGLPFELANVELTKKNISRLINSCYRRLGLKDTVVFADKLMYTGFGFATRAGVSIGIDDMTIPDEKAGILEEAETEVLEIQQQYQSGLVTAGERYNKVVDIWSRTNERVAKAMMDTIGTEKVTNAKGETIDQKSMNSIFIMADSGARGSQAQIRQLAGMRGLMAKPDGSIIETPITSNFREGLNVQQYFISTHGARKGLADTALKTANSGYLTRRLVDVAQDVVITEDDCGTVAGLSMTPIVEGGDVVEPLRDRVLGRVVAEDVFLPGDDEDPIVTRNTLLDEQWVQKLEDAGVQLIKVRSTITCESSFGVCANCYGRDLAHGHLVNHGEAVGVVAAQSIGEPGTQLTMRTFHIGGAASRAVAIDNVTVKTTGTFKFNNIKSVGHASGGLVAVSRSGELSVLDPHGRERERYKL
ncbi:MAG: DNA-directed RNA polymerase subunit beta', partial [Gammaproteobacteria bacterium]|nr:DNA-directed RNA polymerase subunit beta' [Gammaproteobacteria bacterium]